ncbi:MAG: hypothetical protein L3J91_07270, partial [Thermoplasmata archaeon]|nr:hypothetical protein [Thermoplasmata archaeon]
RQGVRAGRVHLTRERATRLLQEGIRGTLSQPVEVDEGVRSLIAGQEAAFLTDLAQRMPAPTARLGGGVGPLKPEAFPPCIRRMRSMLEASENLSHSGRFALAAFLHRAGASFETIVDAYRGAPDFDEGVTRYQVENITRHHDGKGYEPPECATLRAHGLCFRDGDPAAAPGPGRMRDTLCHEPTLKHPLQYYRKKGGTVADREPPDGGRT